MLLLGIENHRQNTKTYFFFHSCHLHLKPLQAPSLVTLLFRTRYWILTSVMFLGIPSLPSHLSPASARYFLFFALRSLVLLFCSFERVSLVQGNLFKGCPTKKSAFFFLLFLSSQIVFTMMYLKL